VVERLPSNFEALCSNPINEKKKKKKKRREREKVKIKISKE
jgi:hypothetical protein